MKPSETVKLSDTMIGTVIITGASGSVGAAATKAMAQHGYTVIMACRNLKKGQTVLDSIIKEVPEADLHLMQLEMSSEASIHKFVQSLISSREGRGREGVSLFNNAGVLPRRFSLTDFQGQLVETTFAVNYLAPSLLTEELIKTGILTSGSHIVNMISLTTRFAHFDNDTLEKYSSQQKTNTEYSMLQRLRIYSSSKLALQNYTEKLAQAHPEMIIRTADPGIVDSNMISMGKWFDPLADIFFRPFIHTPERGASSAVRALLSTNN